MSTVCPIFRPPKSRRLVSAWVVGSHAEHALEVVAEFQDIFDQVILMCNHAEADGSLPAAWSRKERREYTKKLNDLGVSVLNDFSGLKETWAALAQSPEAVARLVENMVADCEETGADGVDLDFEQLPPRERFAYANFVRDLSEALHQRGKMLSICTASPSRAEKRDYALPFLDTSILAHYVDHVRPMNYDLFYPSSPVLGPTSTAPWARERMQHLSTQVPRHKIVMGLPTYSVDWDVTEPKNSRQVYDHQWLAKRTEESEIGLAWLPFLDVNLLRYMENGNVHYVYLSDAQSTQSHLETVDELDLAGVCFWAMMGEDPAIWECVRRYFARRQ